MTSLKIDHQIIEQYPDVLIGYLCVSALDKLNGKDVPQELTLTPGQTISAAGLTLQNMVEHPTLKSWRSVYENCGVKPRTYKSSVESLLRRFIKDDYRRIHPAVDIYNYISSAYILPMGGYNLSEIRGNLVLRHARENDEFVPLSGETPLITNKQIVYADDESVICWMWNHKDARRSMLLPDTNRGVFTIDSILKEEHDRVHSALRSLENSFTSMGVSVYSVGTLDARSPEIPLKA
jgi:DNA/RNA-binding domain of Phe-tRNA-synthetase-like protein